MDRQMVYPGAVPLDTDLLYIQRNVAVALGVLARCVLGTGIVAEGLGAVPGGGLSVLIGPGSLTANSVVDEGAFGSLPVDARPLVRSGINLDATALTVSAPASGAQVWLVQAALKQVDGGALALPYYNAANPAVSWSGPLNSGQAQNTRRAQVVALTVKAGVPQPDGSQTAPAPDAGWVGLYGVTVRAGAAAVGPGDIAVLPGAPFLPYRLPQLTPGFSRQTVIASTGGWTVPSGVQLARVRLVGAGGGGGGGDTGYGGGGGGAGGYAEAVVPLVPGQIVPVLVGAGGVGGGPATTGGPGGGTSFGSSVSALGGQGGASNNPDSHGGGGGSGSAGALLLVGGAGSDGPKIGGVPGGCGGVSALGGGGRGAFQGGAPSNGQAAGSGAGGAYGAPSTGGNGAGGIVIIEF